MKIKPRLFVVLLILSLIGKHDPVSGCTVARWLRSLMEDTGIDTSIFKSHSVRGATCSTAAAAEGITTKDILDAADWSSEGTFQQFYCRELGKDRTTFGTTILSTQHASNNTC